MKSVQEMVEKIEVTGSAAAGLVEVTIKGNFLVSSIKIDEGLYKEDVISSLPILLKSAFNDAVEKVRAELQTQAQSALL